MITRMQRREFITLLGGAAAAWPLAARAQQGGRMRRIGVLASLPEHDPEMQTRLARLRQGLERLGWSEGRNVRVDYRFPPASGAGQAQELAKELIALQPDVIVGDSTPMAAALQRETRELPIVFVAVSDPIGSGFIASLAWPPVARAQQSRRLSTIGFLESSGPSTQSERFAPFVQRLRELGWNEGRNIAIEYRWGDGRNDRFSEIAAEFVRLKVDVIVTTGTPTTIAAKQQTSAIPIVFVSAGDPVGTGIVASLARPGGNITGLSNQTKDIAGKRVELLHEIVPDLRWLAIMVNADNS